MGKKTLNRNKKENPPKRWDKIIGAVTLLTIVIFGFIIYNDYNGSSSKTASVNAEKNTVKQTESEKVTAPIILSHLLGGFSFLFLLSVFLPILHPFLRHLRIHFLFSLSNAELSSFFTRKMNRKNAQP